MHSPTLLQVLILAVIQGAAELLPVSSSAHVIVAEKLMGLDPTLPAMTFLLVMLHLGTMFAVLWYFWPRWKARLAVQGQDRKRFLMGLGIATGCTAVLGLALKWFIEKIILRGSPHAEVESLFGSLPLIASALLAVGILILIAGGRRQKTIVTDVGGKAASLIGLVQGLCLPFRGFSRSGATISAAMLLGIDKALAEDFSFALAVILTPPIIAREAMRLSSAAGTAGGGELNVIFAFAGMVLSFCAGLAALKWLSSWIEKGRWSLFGYYCLAASACVWALGLFTSQF